ncbi:hypothetical protein FOA52_011989 [Chlamydomonas sp. UWO 241]|nr:hypothetical protein FOA52_011989 [Chlamydomonas sp. UWO 241]
MMEDCASGSTPQRANQEFLRGNEQQQEQPSKRGRVSSAEGTPTPKQRLIVIGAGFAGLSAARTIQGARETGVEVIVLEASTQVGGRARTGQMPGGEAVEMGATWFHGIHGNPLYEIAVWEGLVRDLRGDPALRRHHINWKVDFARPLEQTLMAGPLREAAEDALEMFQEVAMEMSGEEPPPDESVGAFLRRKFDDIMKSHKFHSPEELAVFSEGWLFREKQQCSFDGFYTPDDVSTIFPWEFQTLDGPNMPVPGGLQSIAQSLSTPLEIRFEHRVSSIEWGSGGVCITCGNGVVLEADAVLVTTSIGVLQAEHHTMFQPPLPEWKRSALYAVRLGVADKIFVEFDVDPVEYTAATEAAEAALLTSDSDDATASPPKTEYEDPWNIGRRGATDAEAANTTSAQVTAPVTCTSSSGDGSATTTGGTKRGLQSLGTYGKEAGRRSVDGSIAAAKAKRDARKRRHKRKEIRTFALMWPVPQPALLGTAGLEASKALLPAGLPHDTAAPGSPLAALPAWLRGIHSIRFNPGPDFIEASEAEKFNRAQAQAGTGSGPLLREEVQGPPKTAGAVLWIAGDTALQMERLSDEEVARGIEQLLATFPSVRLPPGASPINPRIVRSSWGTNELFRGSYSYLRAGVENGEVVDLIAEPLTTDTGLPVVMFAGEATHRHYMGTVHGAYLSGFREASRFMVMEQQAHWGNAQE